MNEDLRELDVKPLRGDERIGAEGLTVTDFWRWGFSDLMNNVTRSALAEYLVAAALGARRALRDDWGPDDVVTPENIMVQVKASGYCGSWHQNRLSKINFNIGGGRAWDRATNTWSKDRRRHSDVWVFAVHAHTDKPTANPLELGQWRFYVCSTADLDGLGEQRTIGLRSLQRRLQPKETDYAGLHEIVRRVAKGP